MWILEPTEIFSLFGHSFGIGWRLDYTMFLHLPTYGILVWPGCYLWRIILRTYPIYAFEVGVLMAAVMITIMECFQSWQFHYECDFGNCGYFGIGDFSVVMGALIIVIKWVPIWNNLKKLEDLVINTKYNQ